MPDFGTSFDAVARQVAAAAPALMILGAGLVAPALVTVPLLIVLAACSAGVLAVRDRLGVQTLLDVSTAEVFLASSMLAIAHLAVASL